MIYSAIPLQIQHVVFYHLYFLPVVTEKSEPTHISVSYLCIYHT